MAVANLLDGSERRDETVFADYEEEARMLLGALAAIAMGLPLKLNELNFQSYRRKIWNPPLASAPIQKLGANRYSETLWATISSITK